MRFAVGTKLLAEFSGLFYDAVVLAAEMRCLSKGSLEEQAYKVHYQGWNRKWDQWVRADRCIEKDAAGLATQAAAAAELKARKEREIAVAAAKKSKVSNRKRKIDVRKDIDDGVAGGGGDGGGGDDEGGSGSSSSSISAGSGQPEVELPLNMGLGLKKLLVEDWEHVVQDQKIIRLPRECSVQVVLDQFVESKRKSRTTAGVAVYQEIVAGLKEYFNRCLPKLLLYRLERIQYDAMSAIHVDGAAPSSIYGAEHLLRLFIKLPQLLGRLHLAPDASEPLQIRLNEVLKFLAARKTVFNAEYFHPDESYMREYNGKSSAGSSSSAMNVDAAPNVSKSSSSGASSK